MLLKLLGSAAALAMFLIGTIRFSLALRPLKAGESATDLENGMPVRGWRGAVWWLLWAVGGGGVFLGFWLQ